MVNVYGDLASWVYHIDKPIGHSFGDIEYYLARLEGCCSPILEAGVGNGRVLILLLESDLKIVGFDASKDMFSYCVKECDDRNLSPLVTCQKFNDFKYETKFEAIIMPAGSFQLIEDLFSAMEVLKRFYDHLLPGGRVIIDIDNIEGIVDSTSPPD